MIRLAQSLGQRSADERVWRGRTGWRSAGAIRAKVAELRQSIDAPRVALAFADDEALAIGLLAVEGYCEAALLVPASWDQAMLDRYWARSGAMLLVTDRLDLSGERTLRKVEPAVAAGAPRRADRETLWIIPTSGTTGEPKLVEHGLASLARTVKGDTEKGRKLTWGLIYELARFAGVQVFLQAMMGGSRLVFTSRTVGVDGLVAELIGGGCNAVSATPTLWRLLMMAESAGRLPLRLVTLGGEIAEQSILSLLTTRFPTAKVIHIYASTEAGVGFSVNDGLAGFPTALLSEPPRGVVLRVDETGVLWLRPSDARQRFLGEDRSLVETDGWINSGDQVRVVGERCFFLGRSNGAINVGGNKVFPEEIEICIRAVEGVVLAGVRARANPIVGSVVEAFVKPHPAMDRDLLRKAIVSSCRASLAPYKVPALVTWVDDLAVNTTGKLVRS